jgi:signal transduction histidine kinase
MMGIILGNREMALEFGVSDEFVKNNLNEILKATERSADLTGKLLAFARKQTVVPIIPDLNAAIDQTFLMLNRLIGEEINLEWSPCSGIARVMIDPSQIDHILTNLCVNSRDATIGSGTITIETALVTIDKAASHDGVNKLPGDYVKLSVTDTGRTSERFSCPDTPQKSLPIKEPRESVNFIQKPFSVKELTRLVRDVLKRE